VAFYPAIYFFVWFPVVYVRIQQAAGGYSPLITQLYVTGLLPWNGFINSLWYGYSRQIFSSLVDIIFSGKINALPRTASP